MAWKVDAYLVRDWLASLDESSREQVKAALWILQSEGPQLGRPLVDRVRGSVFSNMKELRPGSSGRTELRILFIFDPQRSAILLVGGDKAGRWSSWYRKSIRLADKRYANYLKEIGGRS